MNNTTIFVIVAAVLLLGGVAFVAASTLELESSDAPQETASVSYGSCSGGCGAGTCPYAGTEKSCGSTSCTGSCGCSG